MLTLNVCTTMFTFLSLLPSPSPLPHRRTSPGPHHAMQPQMMQAKGQPHPQQQLQTPATPIAPNQGSYAAVPSHSVSSYTHTMGMTGPSGIYMPSGSGQPTNQAMFGTGNVPSMGYTGQTRVTVPGGGTIQGRPRTMPITSPSPTPGTGNRTLGGSGSLPPRTSYTSYHQGTGIPISTVAQYSSGTGSYPSANYGSPGLSGTPIYQTGTPGGRVVRGSTPYGPSGTSKSNTSCVTYTCIYFGHISIQGFFSLNSERDKLGVSNIF